MAHIEANRASPLLTGLASIQRQCPEFFGVFEYPNIIRDPVGRIRHFNHNVLFDLMCYNDEAILMTVSTYFHQFLLTSFVVRDDNQGVDVDFPITSCMMDLCSSELHHQGLFSLEELFKRTFRYHATGTVAWRVIRWLSSHGEITIDRTGKALVIDF